MVRKGLRPKNAVPTIAVAIAAVVVGCGGGGGAAPRSAGSGGFDLGGTTGEITTGGTTGASATTGSGGNAAGTTGSDTSNSGTVVASTTGGTTGTTGGSTTANSTAGGTTGSPTGSDTTGGTTTTGGGTTTTGGGTTTTGGGTTTTTTTTTTGGGGTTGAATTGGGTTSTGGTSTTGGSTTTTGGTTGTATTGTGGSGGATTTGTTGTTDSSTGGTTGTPGSTAGGTGVLRPDAVYFGRYGDASVVSSILPDGTGRIDAGGDGPEVSAAVPDPTQTGRYVYAANVDGRVGVYRGATFDPSASETLAAPSFDYVLTLQAAGDGSVLVVVGVDGEGTAYLLRGGSKVRIGVADSAAISPDGLRVAFSSVVDGFDLLYVWNRTSGDVRRLADLGDSLFPSFSKDGAWVLFSSNRDGAGDTPFDLYQVPTAGGTVERITNTPGVSELGACFNEARNRVSYVGISDDPDLAGLYILSNAGTLRIADDSDLNVATYWTDTAGRSRTGARGVRFQSLRRKR